ncbi:MAG: SDR family oxidoreductase [Sphaerochaetaceae bacterium]|jgi:sorbitol-6-phosphate 2-dehydrogenase|nr:SDR family oxidoreductase [Sphaerochaetaceae bacterium]
MDRYVASYVRGLTFDGEKGLFVHTLTDCKRVADLVLGEASENWKAEFESFCKKNGEFPSTVGFAGSDLKLGLGVSYDEAAAGAGVSRKPCVSACATRSDVVKDKVCVVTGGAQGFGEGMVRALAENGAFVYVADMNVEGAQKVADSLNKAAGCTVAVALGVNVTSEESTEAMIDEIGRLTGGFDLFVSNAGVLRAGSVKEMTLKDFQFVTSVDYMGFFVCTKYAARLLAVQNSASNAYPTDIICISSKSGLQGSNKNGAYAGAKFGVIGLVQSFAMELVTDNVKVNAICPGNFLNGPLWSDPVRGLFVQYLNTGKVPGAKTVADVRAFYEGKVPMKRGCETSDVMKAMLYIIEQKYETGQAVPVTGGQVMLN